MSLVANNLSTFLIRSSLIGSLLALVVSSALLLIEPSWLGQAEASSSQNLPGSGSSQPIGTGQASQQQQQQQQIKNVATPGTGSILNSASPVGGIANPQNQNVIRGHSREIEKQIVDKILGEGYDKRIRPAGTTTNSSKIPSVDGQTSVTVNTLVRSISKIDDVTMEYYVQLTLRQEWTDDRLAFGRMSQYKNYAINSITLTEQERIWKPDLFFRNEKEGHFHKIIMPNVLLRIDSAGAVLYSIRISLVLACPMDLKYYPLDKQNCTIEMASYGYTERDLKFVWKDQNPVQIAKPLNLPRFTLETHDVAYCTSRTTTGAYSCLRIDLIFKREFSYYLIQIYIPCCMLVIVSWVSFWLDPNAIPARVSLGVTTLLTMATQISGINASLPPVSYTKAIDVWTGVCLTFVFSALLEFALVNYASRSDQHKREMLTSALTHTQKMRWREATAAAAAAGVAPPTSPPPDENSPTLLGSKQTTFFGAPVVGLPHSQLHMSSLVPQRASSAMTNGATLMAGPYPTTTGTNSANTNSLGTYPGAQSQDPMLHSAMVNYPSNGQTTSENSARLRGAASRANHQPIVTVEAGLGPCPLAAPCPPNGGILTLPSSGTNPINSQSTNGAETRVGGGRRRTRTKSLLSLVGLKQSPPATGSISNVSNPSSSGHKKLSSGQGPIAGNAHCPLHYSPLDRRRDNFCLNWLRKFPTRSKRIDVISRIFFPLKFALFNLVYWTTYLFREEDTIV